MGYIPQSKLSVNLDDIYVKKPCPMSALIEIKLNTLSGEVEIIKEKTSNTFLEVNFIEPTPEYATA